MDGKAQTKRRAPPVLVIGREGQLAQALRLISAEEVPFVCLGRGDGVDITNARSMQQAMEQHRPDIVVNAAAYTAVDRAESEPETAFAINRDGVAVLAELCAERKVTLIHVSTDYVFDGSKSSAYVEDDPIAPLGVYGASKAAGERALREKLEQHLILRTSWVYSQFGGNFVKTMLRLAETKDEVRIVADQQGCPTAAEDLAEAITSIVRSLRSGGRPIFGTFHLAGRGETTWCGFATEIFALRAAQGRRTPRVTAVGTTDYPTAAKRPANSRLDCGKIEKAYGVMLPPWQKSLTAILEALATRERAP
jgi:dTDP-4-dehydrorhamnose reductase